MIHKLAAYRYQLLALLLLALDQLSKEAAQQFLVGQQQRLELTSFLELWVVHNPGAAFSMLSNAAAWGRWFLSIVAGAIVLWLLLWLRRCTRPEESRGEGGESRRVTVLALALALLLGGALGNLLDRLLHGVVVDFIVLHYRAYYFPVFNFADICITLGVCLLLLHAWQTRNMPSGEPGEEQYNPADKGG